MHTPYHPEPKSLEELRAWADDWGHCQPLSEWVKHLFEEWDAANEECEELRTKLAATEAARV